MHLMGQIAGTLPLVKCHTLHIVHLTIYQPFGLGLISNYEILARRVGEYFKLKSMVRIR